MSYQKAQGLPISTIILAVLGLIILVVLIMAVTGKLGMFGKGTANCEGQGGTCQNTECTGNQIQIGLKGFHNDCTTSSKPYCCKTIL